ncbi:MAG: mechanosensitive ion channel [bacterium]|nr:mechanosensitive ion channel [bacterium]
MQFQDLLQSLINWSLSDGIKVVLILLVAFFVSRFLKILIGRGIGGYVKNKINGERKKRAKTLISVFSGTLSFIVWAVAILMILPEFGLNIAPVLAGLGLVGLAIGMAARDIIADFISGLFILLEGQYFVGDEVKIAGIEGEVKEITLRRTILRDESGILHSFPNSQIKLVSRKEK